MAPASQRRVLVVGGSFAGLSVARDLKDRFLVLVVDAKEYFEYTPGVLRAFVRPGHLDALTFTLGPVIEGRMGCKFLWGEVTRVDGIERTAVVQPVFAEEAEVIDFDYCVIAAGCNFGVFHKWGESLWSPTVHRDARPEGSWQHLDERFLEGRRRHIFEENEAIGALSERGASVLVVGAGFIGVEWVTELQYFFPGLRLTIVDAMPQCLGPLPEKAAAYCSRYMHSRGIKQFYNLKFALDNTLYSRIGMPDGPDKVYVCVGVKASNYFMPEEVLSERGPGGGGWILMDMTLAVKTRSGKVWSADEFGYGRIYAVGDCNYGAVDGPGAPDGWPVPPIPKISYPGEEQAVITARNIQKIDRIVFHGKRTSAFGRPLRPSTMHWPWGAGMFATSLGPHDACFVAGACWVKNSGALCLWGQLSAVQKEVIEASKVNECAYGLAGRALWYFVHHTPVHLFGGGPKWGY